MAYAYVGATKAAGAAVSRSPTAGNLIVFFSSTSTGGGTPTITSIVTTGGGAVSLTQRVATFQTGAGDWLSVFDLFNCPAGVTAFTATYNGGTPGTCKTLAVEYSGIATSSAFIAGNSGNAQSSPGTTTDVITSGTATSVGSAPALILGVVQTPSGDADTVAGTGYTGRFTADTDWLVIDKRVIGTGSYQVTATAATHGGTDRYNTWLQAYAEPASAGSVLLLNSRITGGLREISGNIG